MELSASVVEGLHLAGDAAHIPDDSFDALVRVALDAVLTNKDAKRCLEEAPLSQLDSAAIKEAFAAVVTLTIEAAKHDADTNTITSHLEDCKFSSERIKSYNNIFMSNKQHIRTLLSRIGTYPPHIVDVDWRLDYYIKDNHKSRVNQPTYLINIKTEECGEPDIKDVQFACSVEQLQDLVSKLKDACKSLERTAQNS